MDTDLSHHVTPNGDKESDASMNKRKYEVMELINSIIQEPGALVALQESKWLYEDIEQKLEDTSYDAFYYHEFITIYDTKTYMRSSDYKALRFDDADYQDALLLSMIHIGTHPRNNMIRYVVSRK